MAMISTELLRRHPHFEGISEDALRSIAMLSTEASFPAGATIFAEKAAADRLFLITRGEVDLLTTFASGETTKVGTLVSGDLMALSSLVEPHVLSFTAVARKDVRLVAMDAASLRRLMDDEPVVGYRLLRAVSKALVQRLYDTRILLASGD